MTLPEQMRPFPGLHQMRQGLAPEPAPPARVVTVEIAPPSTNNHDPIREALSQIASCSPCVLNPGTPQEQSCNLCLAHINHARAALGEQPWPAVPHTPVASPSVPADS